MANIIDPILPIVSILGYWAIILGSFGGPGRLMACGIFWHFRPLECFLYGSAEWSEPTGGDCHDMTTVWVLI